MKRFALAAMLAVLLLPGVALAGPATDAALGLGAFAVFNQILSGTGIFGAVAAPAPVYAAPAPVYVAPPPPPVYVPPAPVYIAPPPPPVAYYPAPPVYYGPRVVYAPRRHGWERHERWEHRHW
ncbi:MAG TPA: hypothetical protein VFL90_10415 [Methylomirabilota bacterium]|nr:hypothetical protein [Methylomirabilota bacterium]